MAEVDSDWAELKATAAWTPLTTLGRSFKHVGGVLFELSPTQFLICPPYNEHFEEQPGIPGFVAAVLWAAYEGAARRAVLMDVEADLPKLRPIVQSPPPSELLPGGAGDTYGEIVSNLRAARGDKFLESVTYRIAKDGAFVHRNISAAPYAFFFRNRKEDDHDRCYAIEYRLPGHRKAADYAQLLNREREAGS